MGWKGTLRAWGSVANSISRDSRRRQRELEQRAKYINKLQEIERNQLEVEQYENYMDRLISIHKECSNTINWNSIKASQPPKKPDPTNVNEDFARKQLQDYKPNIFAKLFKLDKKKISQLQIKLESAIEEDKIENEKILQEYTDELNGYNLIIQIADQIISKNLEGYKNAISEINPFEEIKELGSSLDASFINENLSQINFYIHDKKVIPTHIKNLLKSGKVSVKEMPNSKSNEIYQDYVCSAMLRIAREMFAILPIKMVAITAIGSILNESTGYKNEVPILSAAIPKETLEALNLETIDPSSSFSNFLNNMSFSKTTGFKEVKSIDVNSISI